MPFVVMGICHPNASEIAKKIEVICKKAWLLMNGFPKAGGELKEEDVGGLAVVSLSSTERNYDYISLLNLRTSELDFLARIQFFYVFRGNRFDVHLNKVFSVQVSATFENDIVEVLTIPVDSENWLANPVWAIEKPKE